jgi:hypothetical protein
MACIASAQHLKELVELDFGYAIAIPTVRFANDVGEHVLECCKQTATSAAGEQIIWVTRVLSNYVGEGKGSHLVFLRSAWSYHVVRKDVLKAKYVDWRVRSDVLMYVLTARES